jgi:hypothetical protein
MGGMIARNPKNHADQWYVARAYFLDNFAEGRPAEAPQAPVHLPLYPVRRACRHRQSADAGLV